MLKLKGKQIFTILHSKDARLSKPKPIDIFILHTIIRSYNGPAQKILVPIAYS